MIGRYTLSTSQQSLPDCTTCNNRVPVYQFSCYSRYGVILQACEDKRIPVIKILKLLTAFNNGKSTVVDL